MEISGSIRAVAFDLDDTLRFNQPHANAFFSEFVASLGIELNEEKKAEAHRWGHSYWAMSENFIDDLQAYNGLDDDSFWDNYTRLHLKALGVGEEQVNEVAPKVHTHMRKKYKPKSELAAGTPRLLDTLRSRGILVGLLTNRSRPIYKEIAELGLDLHLDFYLTAGQMGAFKPNKLLFMQMLEFLGLRAEEVLYVGDNYFADMEGAKNAAMPAVLVDPLGLYPNSEFPVVESVAELLSLFDFPVITRA